MTRRKFIQSTALAAAATPLLPRSSRAAEAAAPSKLKGNINHSACRWCYSKVKLDDLCADGKEMGLVAIDLLQPSEFETVKKYGLVCSMVFNPVIDGIGGIGKAWNRVEHHDKLVTAYEQRLKETADAGYERLICFSGNRAGLDDEQGLKNCAEGLKKILPLAEKLDRKSTRLNSSHRH